MQTQESYQLTFGRVNNIVYTISQCWNLAYLTLNFLSMIISIANSAMIDVSFCGMIHISVANVKQQLNINITFIYSVVCEVEMYYNAKQYQVCNFNLTFKKLNSNLYFLWR